MKNKLKHNKLIKRAFLYGVLLFLLTSLIMLTLQQTLLGKQISEIFTDKGYWTSTIEISVIEIVAYLLFGYIKRDKKEESQTETEKPKVSSKKKGYRKIVTRNNDLKLLYWDENKKDTQREVLGMEKKYGAKDSKDIRVLTASQYNTAVVSPDGAAKAKGLLDVNILSMASGKEKDRLIVVDSDRNLYLRHKKQLAEEGYKVTLIDFENPNESDRWNPFESLICLCKRIRELDRYLESHDGKYYGGGERYETYKEVRERVQALKEEVHVRAEGIVSETFSLDRNKKLDKNTFMILHAFVDAFAEDFIDGKIDELQFNWKNIKENLTKYCDKVSLIKNYLFENRKKYSKSREIMKSIINLSDKDLIECLFNAEKNVKETFAGGLDILTSYYDIKFVGKNDVPDAVFINCSSHTEVIFFLLKQVCDAVQCNSILKCDSNVKTTFVLNGCMDLFRKITKDEGILDNVLYKFFVVSKSTEEFRKCFDDVEKVRSKFGTKILIGEMDDNEKRDFCGICFDENSKDSIDQVLKSTPFEFFNLDDYGAIVSIEPNKIIYTSFEDYDEFISTLFSEGTDGEFIIRHVDYKKCQYDISCNNIDKSEVV